MKKTIVTIIAVIVSFNAFGIVIDSNLMSAICQVESKGKVNAKGDYNRRTKEYRAIGAFQLWKCYVDDVNNILKNKGSKKRFSYNDRYNFAKSHQMTVIYLLHYGKVYEKKTGKKATYEVLSRIHNGGPNGYKNPKTIKYWNKVKAILN